MMPFQRSPCAICHRHLIEHYSDPKDVLCGSCDYLVNHKREEIAREKRAKVDKACDEILAHMEKPEAPPTVEHSKPPGGYDWSMMIVAVAMASGGFIAGFLARGGV